MENFRYNIKIMLVEPSRYYLENLIGVSQTEAEQRFQSLDLARAIVAEMSPCVRKDLRPYARLMERLVGKSSHLLTPGTIAVLEERKRDLERGLADKYAKGDMVEGINEFLLSNKLNNPEVRRTLVFWTQNPTPY